MKKSQDEKTIKLRDPIHGFIHISELERKIMDAEPFQRLRSIRQLATTFLVYHGAEHTRFGHSLGVMHLVSKSFDSAVANYEKRNGKSLFSKSETQSYKEILRLYALVHDLGHPPFSHTGEDVFEKGLKHEHFTKRFLLETEISNLIRESSSIDPELIWLIFGEKGTEAIKNMNYKLPDHKFLKSFMDSDIDCDKMDYLLRDSHYCGVSYGSYDVNRLVDSLNVHTKDDIMQLAVERGGLHAFEEFVIARYFMFIQVYFHKTRRFLDVMLTDLLKEILTEPISSDYPLEKYLQLTDGWVLAAIHEMKNKGHQKAINFLNRTVYTCVYETPSQSTAADIAQYKTILNTIRKKFKNVDIIEDSPSKVAIEMLETDGIPILTKFSDTPNSLQSESNLLLALTNAIRIQRIYVERGSAEKINKHIKSLI